jgi:hypothetical protein
MADVTIDSKDLEILVKLLWEFSTERRAHTMVRVEQMNANRREAVMHYLEAVNEAWPKAKRDERAILSFLLETIATGGDVRKQLARFVEDRKRSVDRFERTEKWSS